MFITKVTVVDPKNAKSGFYDKAFENEVKYAIAGLYTGAFCITMGCLLFLVGVGGNSTVVAKVPGAEITIWQAAPGAILFLVGVGVIFLTRYDVTIGSGRTDKQ